MVFTQQFLFLHLQLRGFLLLRIEILNPKNLPTVWNLREVKFIQHPPSLFRASPRPAKYAYIVPDI